MEKSLIICVQPIWPITLNYLHLLTYCVAYEIIVDLELNIDTMNSNYKEITLRLYTSDPVNNFPLEIWAIFEHCEEVLGLIKEW